MELVYKNNNGKDVTSSLLVADKFGKSHKNVLRDIRNLECSQEFIALNFELMLKTRELQNGGYSNDEFYEITKDGFSFLVMGYTGAKAAKFKEDFIVEFNKREALLKNDDYILTRAFSIMSEKNRLLEQQLSQKDHVIEEQIKTLQIQAPKVEYYDTVLQSSELIQVSKIAMQVRMTAEKLNRFLEEKKVIRKVGGTWILTAKYLESGFGKMITFPYTNKDGVTKTSHQLRWTEKGKEFIIELLKKHGRTSAI
jgi:Rha family phage regulatory protein